MSLAVTADIPRVIRPATPQRGSQRRRRALAQPGPAGVWLGAIAGSRPCQPGGPALRKCFTPRPVLSQAEGDEDRL